MPLLAFDPFDPVVVADPYPAYAQLHAGERVQFQERWDIWVLSRHSDVRAATRDHRRLTSADGVTYVRAPLPMMLTMDPPDHERLRRIAGREFAPRGIERFRERVESFVRDGFDELTTTGDVVETLSVPVPIRVMASILGVPESDLPQLRRMSDDLVQAFAIAPSATAPAGEWNPDFMRIGQAITDIHAYFGVLIEERRAHPSDDLLTELIRPASEGTLTPDELSWFCLLLLVAGIETTTNLISNMVIALAEHPDQWELLRSRPELAGSAVNETLRFDSPIQGFFRSAREPYPVGDTVIPEGARVLLAFGAANRDPLKYAEPDAFWVDRDPVDHLAFGAGIHRCLGAGLAELEGRIVLEELIRRADRVELAGDVVRAANPTLRGAAKLPVRLAVAS